MSSGLLLFTLGLTTNAFTGPLGAADSKLKGFLGSMVGLGAIVAGVQKQIEKGAGLKQLSDQTGETIGNLYRLQSGFKAVGLDADSAGNTLFMLNKALGGINDNGEPTAGVFAQIGLSIDTLKKLNAPEQLLSIASALNKLDSSSATSAAGKIFGRYNAREFLQLSRNADEFTDALRKGGVQAAIFDRYGRTFEKIEIATGQIKEQLSGVFLGIASGIGPALENVLQMLNGIDLSGLGRQIGNFITALTQSFREGKFSELIGDSLKLGFESILIFAPAIFEKVGLELIKVFEKPLTFLQAGMDYAFAESLEHGAEGAGRAFLNNASWGLHLGDKVFGKDKDGMTFEKFYKERQAEGVKFDFGFGAVGTADMDADNQKRWHDAMEDFRKSHSLKEWTDLVQNLVQDAPKPGAARNATGGAKESFGAVYNMNHTALEKMGFVFRGGAGSDPQTQTARNTAKMVNLLQSIHQKMSGGNGNGPLGDPFMNAPAI